MGDLERETELGDTGKADSNRVPIIAILMTLIAFLAPFAMAGYSYGYSFYLNITAVLWTLNMTEFGFSFQFITYSLLTMIPFYMFRFAFVYQITRYYQGKTTRGRTSVVAILSDAPILALYVLFIITSTIYGGSAIYGGIGLDFPLPIMMIVGLLLLWRSPVLEAKVPWEGADEPTPWWDENPEDKIESTAENGV